MRSDEVGRVVVGAGVEGLEWSGVGPRERGLEEISVLRGGGVFAFNALFCPFGAEDVPGRVVVALGPFGGPNLMELGMFGAVDVVERLTAFGLAGAVRDDEAAAPDDLT